tara:strand:+ start:156304 stop:156903 length:600 start_codon:yes stop_codon:yes gene_type:complete
MRHLVGVTQRVEKLEKYDEKRDCLDQRWQRMLAEIGVLSVPIPNDPETFSQFVSATNLSGFILTGGNDLNAYGGEAIERDALENQLLKYSEDQDLPVLGVCRGMQVMHVADGGSLKPIDHHVRTRHLQSFQNEEIEVNSYHNWGIYSPTEHFNVLCRCDDGSIEAFEHVNNQWIGIMWHPEREGALAKHDRRILERLFK